MPPMLLLCGNICIPALVALLIRTSAQHTTVDFRHRVAQSVIATRWRKRASALRTNYRLHIAGSEPLHYWSDRFVGTQLTALQNGASFRGDSVYLWQREHPKEVFHPRGFPGALLWAYEQTSHTSCGKELISKFVEDGAFGALTVMHSSGKKVSRDLVDSIAELCFLHQKIGLLQGRFHVLDIGPGYGRLLARLLEAAPDVKAVGIDAVPESTALCESYLRYRGFSSSLCLGPHALSSAFIREKIHLAVFIHTLNEQRPDTMTWWLDAMCDRNVERLFVAVSRSVLPDSHVNVVKAVFASHRYDLEHIGEKFPIATNSGNISFYPDVYMLFRLRSGESIGLRSSVRRPTAQ
eukprot:TRINITY_DN104139_c0_g1_i1.p1 TRINITY_DN104139_c0_g1~~TRINITY_DN104139_c0_g1_i1.p1  ORF type:complete len:351 (-),score=36.67 TRINITY_DN104139_c0_g1_i1:33-1085(-)